MMYWLVGIVIFFCLAFYLYFGHYAMTLFYKCLKHDVKISYIELASMKARKLPINDFLVNAIKLKEKGIDVKIKDFELHMKSGGRIGNVVNILLNAKKSKIDLTYHQAAIMDLDDIAKHKKASNNIKSDKGNNTSDSTQTENSEEVDSPHTTEEADSTNTTEETNNSESENKA